MRLALLFICSQLGQSQVSHHRFARSRHLVLPRERGVSHQLAGLCGEFKRLPQLGRPT